MEALLAYLRRTGFRRGLLGGSRGWMIAGGAAYAVRVLQRASRNEPVVVYREELEPGETVVIKHEPEPPPRGRRRKA
jgi:hypothetical protein